jgi:glycosyltransferase involved in cell wall biosynthesis
MIHLVTPEYPPRRGGVAHYTRQIARELARAGEDVHVWCPAGGIGERTDAFTVHPELGSFGRSDLARTSRLLDAFPAPRRLVVQWVPHGYGFRAMNVSFCWWLWKRAAAGDAVELMVHEPYVAFDARSVGQNIVATVQRLMTAVLLRAAGRVWIAIPAWERLWRPYALGKRIPFTWLPVPSGLRSPDKAAVAAVRARLGVNARPNVGHFGTYGKLITSLLDTALPAIAARRPDAHFLLIGTGGAEFRSRLVARHPGLDSQISATGSLDVEALAAHIAACDVLVQPYPDGISSRRTTAMAGLALGVPVVTTRGRLTEPFWAASGSVRLSDVGDPQQLAEQVVSLLESSSEREQLVEIGSVFYDRHFDVRHTVSMLSTAVPGAGQ